MNQLVTRMLALTVTGLAVLAGVVVVTGQGREFKPVTDAMLLNPEPGEWPNFRRTLNGWGYSPLTQINRQNVGQLQLAWSWQLNPGVSEPTPAVSNGVMYVPNPGGGVQALDAATGELLWDFKTPTPPARGRGEGEGGRGGGEGGEGGRGAAAGPVDPMRNIAIYGDKVFTATGRVQGARLIALNARTGAVVWDKPVGYRHTAGPIIAKGKVVVSTNGCERFKLDDPPCFIAGFDPESGRELWKTSTIARPGEPGGDTWDDLPLMFRAGGDNWQAGSYDPVTNLMYWGTSQAKPWARFQRGTAGDALFTDSTLAIDPDTGRLAWYFQHLPGDTSDSDETFERVLIDYNGRSSVFTMGKLGILWELDRKTGAYRAAHDLGYQDMVNVDLKTGRTTYRQSAVPKPNVELGHCPGTGGFKSWRAMAYHPDTQAFYIPLNLHCETSTYPDNAVKREVGGGGVGGVVKRTFRFHPESPDTLGEFIAMDMKTGRVNWRHRTKKPITTAALTTGGGLVVAGDWEGNLYIHDVTNGKILFQTRLPNILSGFPITYTVRGRQYLAIPVGTVTNGGWPSAVQALVPEKNPVRMNAMFVFALPQK